jgi:peptide chain release factor 1
MTPSIALKLEKLFERHTEIRHLLSDVSVINDQKKFRDLSKEYAELEPLMALYERYQQICKNLAETQLLLEETDAELKKIVEEECQELSKEKSTLEEALQWQLVPKDPDDNRNIYLEIRAGAGGDEASIFAGDLCRMYLRYAEKKGWQTEVTSESHSERGGYKEVIVKISGQGVYADLKFESGTHRVQRVPDTEAQGRIHTSTCTVAIIPEAEEIETVTINPADLRIDTYRASGAGGQHVNKTESAIRITHIPTGTVVECQEERSQHKNRAKAMTYLQSRLLSSEKEKQAIEQAKTRKLLVGTADRSERIRTYNFPQGRLTDHRIGLTLYQLTDIMEGELKPVIEPLIREDKMEQLSLINAE